MRPCVCLCVCVCVWWRWRCWGVCSPEQHTLIAVVYTHLSQALHRLGDYYSGVVGDQQRALMAYRQALTAFNAFERSTCDNYAVCVCVCARAHVYVLVDS